jgi:2'-5' RNA ligase
MLDDAAPAVAAARAELDPVGARRIGLHVTLLHPFVRRADVTGELLAKLRSFFAARTIPAFALARVDEFPDVVAYAAPEPDAELVELMRAIWAEYPGLPPYDGAVDHPVPHATIISYARADIRFEDVRARLERELPVPCAPNAASLVEEYEPDRWRELESFRFGAGA